MQWGGGGGVVGAGIVNSKATSFTYKSNHKGRFDVNTINRLTSRVSVVISILDDSINMHF